MEATFPEHDMTKPGNWLVPLAALVSLAGCNQDGTSTREMERAAIERTRQELGLQPDAALEATVWVGEPHDGDILLCGTVSSAPGAASPIAPQRFAASTDPVQFQIFEDAHSPMVTAEPDMFLSWKTHCAGKQEA